MNNAVFRTIGGSFLAASFLILAPAVALACPVATSNVSVSQQQNVVSSTPVDLTQSASISTATYWGNNFGAESKVSGSQGLWDVNKAQQAQTLTAGSQLWWAGTTGPTDARASTSGSVNQTQQAWGGQPMTGQQDAGLWQKSWVGDQRSQADADIHQKVVNVVGDLGQTQGLASQTQAEGQIYPSSPTCVWCTQTASGSGSFFTRVTVVVDNLFNF